MANPLRQQLAFKKRADLQQVIDTTVNVRDFSRLVEVIEADLSALGEGKMPQQWRQAPVDIKLRFGWAKASPGVPVVEGSASTSVVAVCQRCLEPFELALHAHLKLMLPPPDSTAEACDGYELWECDERQESPADIVEEALIMAMPFSALHEASDECSTVTDCAHSDENEVVQPFADLRSRMATAKKKSKGTSDLFRITGFCSQCADTRRAVFIFTMAVDTIIIYGEHHGGSKKSQNTFNARYAPVA